MELKVISNAIILSVFIVGCNKKIEYEQLGSKANIPIGELSSYMLHPSMFEGIPERTTWGAMQVMQACDSGSASQKICEKKTGEIFSDMSVIANCEAEGRSAKCLQFIDEYLRK